MACAGFFSGGGGHFGEKPLTTKYLVVNQRLLCFIGHITVLGRGAGFLHNFPSDSVLFISAYLLWLMLSFLRLVSWPSSGGILTSWLSCRSRMARPSHTQTSLHYSFSTLPGLWIRIHFLRIRIQLFFSMRIRISSFKNEDPDSESSQTKFVTNYFTKCSNRQKRLLKRYKHWSLSTFC